MKIAIMQPYLFPYLGYFRLINKVDRFIILDDVHYITRGWINRNRLLVNGKEYLFTLPLAAASQNKLINETLIAEEYITWKKKFLFTLAHAYRKAPYYDLVMPLTQHILACSNRNLSSFLNNSLREICAYLHIDTEFVDTTAIYDKNGLRGEERLIDICKQNNADVYINVPGGRELYSEKRFLEENIALEFLDTSIMPYEQGQRDFVPNLSIIDVMMWCGKDYIQAMLQGRTLGV